MALEQRRPRVKVRLKARYVSPRKEFDSMVTSISEAGLFLYATELDPEGTPVRLEFPLGTLQVRATGEVIYSGFQDGLRGMGIKFSRLMDSDRDAIVRLVRSTPALAIS